MIRLPFQIISGNMGAQYHHYLLGIILQEKENMNFVWNHYMGMLVKHFYDSHGDFVFDGIYSCDFKLLQQFIIRGPIDNLQERILQCLTKGIYVCININEQNLPGRQAYQNHYFRHDLLIYGYDEENGEYITAGFDETMEFCEKMYSCEIVEQAYRSMQNEWDYELFAFRWNRGYRENRDDSLVEDELGRYLGGSNPNDMEFDLFLRGKASAYYVNNSYKRYYGIGLYDYLLDRMRGKHRLFLRDKSNEQIGVNDMRTINALRSHLQIVCEWIKTIDIVSKERFLQEIDDLGQELCGAKVLLLRYVQDPTKKGASKFIKGIEKVKEKEKKMLSDFLTALEEGRI